MSIVAPKSLALAVVKQFCGQTKVTAEIIYSTTLILATGKSRPL